MMVINVSVDLAIHTSLPSFIFYAFIHPLKLLIYVFIHHAIISSHIYGYSICVFM